MTEQQLENELAQVRLLSALTYPALRRVVEQGRLIQVPEGRVIIGPGFGSTGFFVVMEGTVAVSLPFGPGLAYLDKGEIFGEMALLEGTERTAYCRAYSDCLLFEIPFGSFHADLAANPVVRQAVDQMYARRRDMNQAILSGGPPPELTPPEKLEPAPAEAAADTGQPTTATSNRAAKPEAPKPPPVYVTA
mgnify:CR=1 FL=1